MRLTSSAFQPHQPIPSLHTCDGKNESPALAFGEVPAQAKSLALIMHDPDAPVGDFVHWVAWNIAADATDVPAGAPPAGAMEGINGAGKKGYFGPCPPSGTHRYYFELYALDTRLDLPASTTRDDLQSAMEGHQIARAELMGTYAREGE